MLRRHGNTKCTRFFVLSCVLRKHGTHNPHVLLTVDRMPTAQASWYRNVNAPLTYKSLVNIDILVHEVCLERHKMKHSVDGVVRADDSHIASNAGGEVQELPTTTGVRRVVDYSHPVLVVHRHLDVVRVRPEHRILQLNCQLRQEYDEWSRCSTSTP